MVYIVRFHSLRKFVFLKTGVFLRNPVIFQILECRFTDGRKYHAHVVLVYFPLSFLSVIYNMVQRNGSEYSYALILLSEAMDLP